MQIKSIAVPRPGFVYLIGSDKYGWYKIGFSKNCEMRTDQLGILLPFKVELFAVWKSADAFALEGEMHDKYSHFHIHGEWFSLGEDERHQIVVDVPPVQASLIFPVGFAHKRPIASSSVKDHCSQKASAKWKSDRNKDQRKRIDSWLLERGLDCRNKEHLRMAWKFECALKKKQQQAPIDVL